MSFADELIAQTGTAADAFDIKAIGRRCFLYDFIGAPIRIWDGQGVLNAGGFEWLGTFDANGMNHHKAPAVRDERDGSAPSYSFGIPYLDKVTYLALKADQSRAIGRDLICYEAIFKAGEGLNPLTSLFFNYRLFIRGVQFAERVEGDAGSQVYIRSASVTAKSSGDGRTRTPGGTMTDTSQRDRARVLGVTSDSGCASVAKNARRTFLVSGG